MNNITQTALTALTLVSLSACSYTNKPSESQNKALNSISSNSQPEKKGAMQSSLDNWLSQDWSPTVEKDEKIQKKYMKPEEVKVVSKTEPSPKTQTTQVVQEKVQTKETEALKVQKEEKVKYVEDPDKHFTLQEYADKAGVYMKAHENDPKKPSNVEKMSKMPGIGSN